MKAKRTLNQDVDTNNNQSDKMEIKLNSEMNGLTKRDYIAVQVMQGLCLNYSKYILDIEADVIVKKSIQIANEFLRVTECENAILLGHKKVGKCEK
jgi:hypothetical protein